MSRLGEEDQFTDKKRYITRGFKAAAIANETKQNAKRGPPKFESAAARTFKIEEDTDHFGDISRVGIDIGNRMRYLRGQKEWSQKDLALKAGVKVDVVRDYENGKAVPNGRIISKFEQVLEGSLRGNK